MPSEQLFSPSTPGHRKPRLSIRARLMIVALLAVVPLMLDRVRILEASRSERIETAYAEAADIAKRSAEAQLEIIDSTQALLQVVARAYVTLVASGQQCASFISGLATDVPWIKGFSVVGADDRIICSTHAGAIGLDVSDRPFIQDTRRSRGLVLSDYVVTRPNSQPTIIAAYPILGKDETVSAIILAPFDLQWVGRLAAMIGQRAGASVFLVDSNGTVLSGIFGRDNSVGHNYSDHPLIRDILQRNEGTVSAAGLDGVRRIFAFTHLPGTDARIVIGFDEREVLSRIDREIDIAYLQLVLFGLLTLFVAWFGGEKLIVEPIRALARTAARIGRGELDVRSRPEVWAAEFAPLASALDDMAIKLSARERELRSTNRHLEELASIDSLSGLANRRSFDTQLETEWQRAAKLERAVSLLMIDVDHFKLFNDKYGHLEGDTCLRLVGEVITSAVDGDIDFVARYGGEEFVVLLPDTGSERALKVAERLRAAVENQRITNLPAPTGYLTVSIGIASMRPRAGETPQSLIEAADAVLYEAKHRGRNTIVGPFATEFSEAS
jgi:diguanylate cyclase (GGDEF)-like protein